MQCLLLQSRLPPMPFTIATEAVLRQKEARMQPLHGRPKYVVYPNFRPIVASPGWGGKRFSYVSVRCSLKFDPLFDYPWMSKLWFPYP